MMPAPKGTRPPAAGMGRKRGARNKMTRALKEMILAALDDAGGVSYLARQARNNPVGFMTLLGKLLPLQVAGENGGYVLTAPGGIDRPPPVTREQWLANRKAEMLALVKPAGTAD